MSVSALEKTNKTIGIFRNGIAIIATVVAVLIGVWSVSRFYYHNEYETISNKDRSIRNERQIALIREELVKNSSILNVQLSKLDLKIERLNSILQHNSQAGKSLN